MQTSGFAELGDFGAPTQAHGSQPALLAQARGFLADRMQRLPRGGLRAARIPAARPRETTEEMRGVAHPVRLHWGMNS